MRMLLARFILRVGQLREYRLVDWINVEPMVENRTRPFKSSKTAQIRVVL